MDAFNSFISGHAVQAIVFWRSYRRNGSKTFVTASRYPDHVLSWQQYPQQEFSCDFSVQQQSSMIRLITWALRVTLSKKAIHGVSNHNWCLSHYILYLAFAVSINLNCLHMQTQWTSNGGAFSFNRKAVHEVVNHINVFHTSFKFTVTSSALCSCSLQSSSTSISFVTSDAKLHLQLK